MQRGRGSQADLLANAPAPCEPVSAAGRRTAGARGVAVDAAPRDRKMRVLAALAPAADL